MLVHDEYPFKGVENEIATNFLSVMHITLHAYNPHERVLPFSFFFFSFGKKVLDPFLLLHQVVICT